MTRTLEVHDKPTREIFEDSYQFGIPNNQRPHAWNLAVVPDDKAAETAAG
jgi:hypothetical protein